MHFPFVVCRYFSVFPLFLLLSKFPWRIEGNKKGKPHYDDRVAWVSDGDEIWRICTITPLAAAMAIRAACTVLYFHTNESAGQSNVEKFR